MNSSEPAPSASPASSSRPHEAPTYVGVELGARRYDIVIGTGLLPELGARIVALRPQRRAMVVTDETVGALHLEVVAQSLERAGVDFAVLRLPEGEATKSVQMADRICNALLDANLERGDMVIALGGGVIGDVAGFAAAITRRGMDLVQVPTSLLAQIDSSVGGKTGVNARSGKNLIGAFHQPIAVIADTGVLDTLSARQFRAGYAEMVKYGLINDAAFFAWLGDNRARIFSFAGAERSRAIEAACRAKARIVAADEKEHGERALLNLGHTFGHALEAVSGYGSALLHGEAIAVGMCMAHRFSNRLNLAAHEDTLAVEQHLRDADLPVRIADLDSDTRKAMTTQAILDAMAQDKKVRRQQLRLVLTRGIGRAFISGDVASGVVAEFLKDELSL